MLILRILLLILSWRLCRCKEFTLAKNADSYGPYVVTFKQYELCKGPKANNASIVVYDIHENTTSFMINYNFTFQVATKLNEVKIHVWHVDGLQKSTLWNYKVDKPCQHYALASLLSKHLSVQPNCVIKKGSFNFTVALNAITEQFFGKSFFYGEFFLKSVITANQGNIMCILIDILFSKK